MPEYTIRPKGASRSTEYDVDSYDVDGKTAIDLFETDWGIAQQPEPVEEVHAQGVSLFLPLDEVWKRRTIRIVGSVFCTSLYDKTYQESLLRQRFMGQRTIRRQGWEIDVTGVSVVERSLSKGTPLLYAYEATFFATPPLWVAVDSLNSISYDADLYPDFGVPYGESQPAFDFYVTAPGGATIVPYGEITGLPIFPDQPHLTINHWGSAFCYASATLTGFPASTVVYMKGLGLSRVKLTTDGAGAAAIAESSRFMLKPGDNPIRLEDETGAAITLGVSARVNFGATRLRYL